MNAPDLDRIRFVTRYFNELQGLREAVPYGLQTLGLGVVLFFPNPATIGFFVVLLAGSLALRQGAAAYYRRLFGEVESQPLALGAPAAPPALFSPAGLAPRPAAAARSSFSRPQGVILIGAVTLFLALRAVSPATSIHADSSWQNPWLQLTSSVVEISDRGHPFALTSFDTLIPQVVYALCGAVLLGLWIRRERRFSQGHYLVLGVLLLALSLFGASLGLVLPALWQLQLSHLASWLLPPVAHLWAALLLSGAALLAAGLLDHWQLVRVLGRAAEGEA